MDLKINKTGFGGKREVIYSLQKAVQEAKRAEVYKSASFGPRPINKSAEVEASKKAVNAYLDSAIYDESFMEVIEGIPIQDIGQTLKSILEPKKVQHGIIRPHAIFVASLVANCVEQEKAINKDIFNKFLDFINPKVF